MEILLSLPPNLVEQFHQIEEKSTERWYCTHDPEGAKLGSGGGTAHLLYSAWKDEGGDSSFQEWLHQKRILIHAGGQSRRLPAYAPSGKILTPIPIFRWARGQKLQQHLLDLQLPLLESIITEAPGSLTTLIASGDVLIRSTGDLPELPEVDVLCMGIWVKPERVSKHGVFFIKRDNPNELAFALQKPGQDLLRTRAEDYNFMIDVGIWLLSEKAISVLMKKCGWNDKKEAFLNQVPDYFDLYTDFGLSLGKQPSIPDAEIQALSCAVVPLPQGEFYHFGTSAELIDSSLALQNRIQDQREILHRFIKPQPNLFVMNAEAKQSFEKGESQIWIENSHIPQSWKLNHGHLLTGIPANNWKIELDPGICLDIVPIGEAQFCVRPYGFEDVFRGKIGSKKTLWMGQSVKKWLNIRGLDLEDTGLSTEMDQQKAALFPIVSYDELSEGFIQWLIYKNPPNAEVYRNLWLRNRLSAEEISTKANLHRLYEQRRNFRYDSLPQLFQNARRSIFYQLDLAVLARDYADSNFDLPQELNQAESTPLRLVHDSMFRAEVLRLKQDSSWKNYERRAFSQLEEFLTATISENRVNPQKKVAKDQVIWTRSPARIDLAGGWTDTPPYCLIYGGRVVNMAIDLNGQSPIQVYAKPIERPEIIIRSIDLSYEERITEFEGLANYNQLDAAFTIAKAALALAGFLPKFAQHPQKSLKDQLLMTGCGIELTLMTSIPKGSGLGTSSILASSVLGTLSSFYGLEWNHEEIGNRTLILEQMLTSGGGWQDQYGGILSGIKILETQPGFDQKPDVKWLPERIFQQSDEKASMLLYYTGITRVANDILGEIVRGMFLNDGARLEILHKLYYHTQNMAASIQRGNYAKVGEMVNKTWHLNQALDKGTNPPSVAKIMNQIDDYLLGGKLAGAGGGGFLFLMAKDPEAALKIKEILTLNPPNEKARFFDFDISQQGMVVSGS